MLRKVILAVMVVLLFMPFYSLFAMTYKGVTMEGSIEVDGQTLVLNGMALRKKFVFKVYVAGLYLPQKETNAEKILGTDGMRHLVMHWVRGVGTGKINDAWYDGLKANTPNHSPGLKKQFDTLCSYMEKVKDGDRIVFTYIPGKGTIVEVKGKEKGVIKGKDFADALFACWIGPKPGPGKGFKEDLLGL
ncbi:MAG: chalcone isomerase family protein [Candidatus Aminicenantes bacterium]|nr:MAG: chalcone isomerase family protein [Candidatus Aminicenantes bacterium]